MEVVINVSTKKYWKGQRRLIQTLNGKTAAQLLMYKREADVGAKTHQESMYGFKPKAIQKAYNMGYRQILWLDASMYILKDLTPIFDIIKEQGYFWQDSGWLNERWTTPAAKEYFGTDKGAMISSGVLGLDLASAVGLEFFKRWLQASEDGMFNGSHEVTRHDQSAASLIIENMGLTIIKNNTIWNYGKEPFHENIIILADGIA